MLTAPKSSHGRWQVLVTWLLLCGWAASGASDNLAGEYQVKSVFIYNFTRFVGWPTNAETSTNAPFVIGIVGEDSFGTILDDAVRGESVGDHPIVVRRFRRGEKVGQCRILFIARSENGRLQEVLDQVRGQPTLTVADTAQAAEQGVMINLLLEDGNVKMEINPGVAESAGLSVSSKLLNLARIVKAEKEKGSSKP